MYRHVTYRELQVLEAISRGLTSQEIAKELYLSDHTIIAHRKKLFSKLNAINAPSLVRKGFELGILSSQKSLQSTIE